MQSRLDDSIYEKYKHAGRIASNARDFGSKLIKEGANILEVANKVELKILNEGGGLAFPVEVDVAQAAEVKNMVETVIKFYGRIDVLLQCAGIAKGKKSWGKYIRLILTLK